MAEAEAMYMRVLQGYEKAWGAEHASTLATVNSLGLLYANQDKKAEAESRCTCWRYKGTRLQWEQIIRKRE
jgi:hypothetical protein